MTRQRTYSFGTMVAAILPLLFVASLLVGQADSVDSTEPHQFGVHDLTLDHACGSTHPSLTEMTADVTKMQDFDEFKQSSNGVLHFVAQGYTFEDQGFCRQCITVPVFWHVVTNTIGSQGVLHNEEVVGQIRVLNQAYQSSSFYFDLVDIIQVENSTLFYSGLHPSHVAHQSELGKHLRKGDIKTLNIYSIQSIYNSLGTATFPSGFNGEKDGVFIDYCTVPDSACHMPFSLNSGKVLVHEVGHWLGLLHTFSGGCDDDYGDYVTDTNAQDFTSALFDCVNPPGNSCPNNDGLDPLDNFMGYSFDCMETFTQGQMERMYAQWIIYRANQGCPLDEGALNVELKLDDHPEENAWSLYHSNGQMITVAQFGEPDEGMIQNGQLCLKYDTPYYFGLSDQAGNGLNATEAYYRMSFDGKELKNDKTFGYWGGVAFTMVDPDIGCAWHESLVQISLYLDARPDETQWKVVDVSDGTIVYAEDLYTLRGYAQYYMYASIWREFCLPEGTYDFIIEDTAGDGFSDNTQEENPFFSVTVDGVLLRKENHFSTQTDNEQFTIPLPSENPSDSPSGASAMPSTSPTHAPSRSPTGTPSRSPTETPSATPSSSPSVDPSSYPSGTPSVNGSTRPSSSPSSVDSVYPSLVPSRTPSVIASALPSGSPTIVVSASPSSSPSMDPSSHPSSTPSLIGSTRPSSNPSAKDSVYPSIVPSSTPAVIGSALPSGSPTTVVSASPSSDPSSAPSTMVVKGTGTDQFATMDLDLLGSSSDTLTIAEAQKFGRDLQAKDCISLLMRLDDVRETQQAVTNELFLQDLPFWGTSSPFLFYEALEFAWYEKMAIYRVESDQECQKVEVASCKYHLANATEYGQRLFRSRVPNVEDVMFHYVAQSPEILVRLQGLGFQLPIDTREMASSDDCDAFLTSTTSVPPWFAPFTGTLPLDLPPEQAIRAWALFTELQGGECIATSSRLQQTHDARQQIVDEIVNRIINAPSGLPPASLEVVAFYQNLHVQIEAKAVLIKNRTAFVCQQAEYGTCQLELARATRDGDLLFRRKRIESTMAGGIGTDAYDYRVQLPSEMMEPLFAEGFELLTSCTAIYGLHELS